MKHGVLGTINVRTAILKNACINTDCIWHTCHWNILCENGCYMLKDNSECISGEKTGFTSVEQYIKEHTNEIKQTTLPRDYEDKKEKKMTVAEFMEKHAQDNNGSIKF